HHPRYTEPVRQHAESPGPKRLLERHRDLPVSRQRLEHTLGLLRVRGAEVDVEALRPLVTVGRSVGPHQSRIAYHEAGMQDFVPPSGWHLRLGRSARMCHHRLELAAEGLLVKFESGLTIAVKGQI